MQKVSIFTLLMLISSLMFSQVAINTDGSAPDASAILDLATTEKGFLLPRMTVYQLQTIDSPTIGLMVFNIDSLDLYIYLGNYWVSVLKCEVKDTIYRLACGDSFTINHVVGNVAPVNKIVTYSTTDSIPGELSKCWITQNLGSNHQATAINDVTEASAGWYWQFNRKQGYKHDGTTVTPAWTIMSIDENSDWLAVNDPCTLGLGSSWRLPTSTEWSNVNSSGGWTNWNDTWNSALKLHAAGALSYYDGSLSDNGVVGMFWSSSQTGYIYGSAFRSYYEDCSIVPDFNKAWGFNIRCLTESLAPIPMVKTALPSNITQTSAKSGGDVTSTGDAPVTARGVCWSINDNPTIADSHTTDGLGTGVFESNITDLNPNSLYYVRAYATNSFGTAYGIGVSFWTPSSFPCGDSITINHVAGNVSPVTKTVTYGIVTNISGEPSKCWITQNLGADHQANSVDDATEASSGWYWQFNRKQGYKHDGATVTPAWTITSIDENSNWTLDNDPCYLLVGTGWRIPTYSEWENVDLTGWWTDWNGPWNSALKMHGAGYIFQDDATLEQRGSQGMYYSSSQYNNSLSYYLNFWSNACLIGGSSKAEGVTIRCLKDL
jgi:hypothetical protein